MDKQKTLGANLIGAVIVGLLYSPAIWILLILGSYFYSGPNIQFLDLLLISLFSAGMSSLVSGICDRITRIKQNRHRVFGVVPTLYEALPWPIFTALLCFIFFQDISWLWIGALAGFIGGAIVNLVMLRPWKDIISEDEYANRSKESDRIIREGFADLRQNMKNN